MGCQDVRLQEYLWLELIVIDVIRLDQVLETLRKSSSPKPVPNVRQSATNHYQQHHPHHLFSSLGNSRSPVDICSGNNKLQQRVGIERCHSPAPLSTVRNINQ